MARIPTVTSEIASRSGRTTGNVQSRPASADQFGAGIGQSLRAVGAGLDDLSAGVHAQQMAKAEEIAANAVAQADFTKTELSLRNSTGPGAGGYQENVMEAYDAWVDEQADRIENDDARKMFRERMTAERRSLSRRATSYEFSTAAENSKISANESLYALDNKIRLDPSRYDDFIEQGKNVIYAQGGMNATIKRAMFERWQSDSARSRFEGMLEAATSVEELTAIEADLRGGGERDWTKELKPSDLNGLLSTIGVAKRSFLTKADADARAALDRLEDRAADPSVLIPREELELAQRIVGASQNPVTIARMARIMRDQALAREYRSATPLDMRNASDTALDGYGVSREDRTALDAAARSYGVSNEFMMRVTMNGYSGDVPVRGLVNRMLAAAPESVRNAVSINNDYRSPDQQASIIANDMTRGKFGFSSAERDQWLADVAAYGPVAAGDMWASRFGTARPGAKRLRNWIALPGKSNHQQGTAADLSFATDEARQWFHANAGRFGGNFRMGHEPWHIEAIGGGGGGASGINVDKGFLERAMAHPKMAGMVGENPSPEAVVAAYAKLSKEELRSILGRKPSDDELYMAHKLGIKEASQLIYARETGSEEAGKRYAELVREYAASGPSDGVSASEYADAARLNDMATDAENRISDDPMTYADNTGVFSLGDLDGPDGFRERGDSARAVADYYNIPEGEMKPLTSEEEAMLGKQLKDGDADQVLEILSSLQQMGGAMARAAISQLDDVDDVYGFAAGMMNATSGTGVAGEIVRGQKRIEENPDVRASVGASDADLDAAFMEATGDALWGISPDQRQAIRDAATAHYIETTVARGGAGEFDTDKFAASVNAVISGRGGTSVIDEVNGQQTVMPPGVSGSDMEDAMADMTIQDWALMSRNSLPPRYVTGELADPYDLADEARLQAIGGGEYRVMVEDGSFLVTGNVSRMGVEPFIFVPTKDRLDTVRRRAETDASMPAPSANYDEPELPLGLDGMSDIGRDIIEATTDGDGLTNEEYRAIVAKYGAAAIDEYARSNGQ